MKRQTHKSHQGRIVIGQKINSVKKHLSNELRKQMTKAEQFLWNHLRHNKLNGLHFRRQQIIDGLIADFYCHECRLVIEIDGPVHLNQKEYDFARDRLLAGRNLKVIRFRNHEIQDDLETVLSKISEACESTQT